MIISNKRYGCPVCKCRALAYCRGPSYRGGKLVNYYQCGHCTFVSSSRFGIPWQERAKKLTFCS